MHEEIINKIKLLASYIESMDDNSVNDYINNHIDDKAEIERMLDDLEHILSWTS